MWQLLKKLHKERELLKRFLMSIDLRSRSLRGGRGIGNANTEKGIYANLLLNENKQPIRDRAQS